MRVKFSSDFLKERRIRMGYEPCEVAKLVGVNRDTYRQWECRGEIPEKHLSKLAGVLCVQESELKAEKLAVMVESMFGIPRSETHNFISRTLREHGISH